MTDFLSLLRNLLQQCIARLIKGGAHIHIGVAESFTELFLRLSNILADLLRRNVQIFLQGLAGAGNRRSNTLGVIDDGLAFIGQFFNQSAHAQFIVRIRVFKRRNFVVNQTFQFAGTGHRPFNTVSQRPNFDANGLSDAAHRVHGFRFRFHEAISNFGHGMGGKLQLLCPANHKRIAPDHQQGQNKTGKKQEQRRHGSASTPGCGRDQVAAKDAISSPNCYKHPQDAGTCGEPGGGR